MGAASLASMIPGVLGKYEVLAFVGRVAGATIRLREGRLRLCASPVVYHTRCIYLVYPSLGGPTAV